MSSSLTVGQVFVPGKFPQHTYNPRENLRLESSLLDYLDEGGSILTLAGPTKTGKSVLVRRLAEDPVWVDGQGIDTVDELWRRIGDQLGVFMGIESTLGETNGLALGVVGGLPGVAQGKVDYSNTEASGQKLSVSRPASSAVRQVLEASGRPLVVDDFHFIDRAVQRQIVRALKPVVFTGVPVILISVSHRVQDVVRAEPDMTGRVSRLEVKFWEHEELMYIAREGFKLLGLEDPDEGIGHKLAQNSFGSPHLMQKFCREVCKVNDVRSALTSSKRLQSPDWEKFFPAQAELSSKEWFTRLLRGPLERGRSRKKWPTVQHGVLDGYGIALAAIASTGPKLALNRDEVMASVSQQVADGGPATGGTTRVLKNMTKLAGRRIVEGPQPSEEELNEAAQDDVLDAQPVLEYVEDGPTSELHIADPFFAFYLKWCSTDHLASAIHDHDSDEPSLSDEDS